MTKPEDRFERLYEEHHRSIYAYLRRRTDAESAREVAADTFIIAWQKQDELPEADAVRSWLYGVAWRLLANRHRKIRRYRAMERNVASITPHPQATADIDLIRGEEIADIHSALSQLRMSDQEVLRLATWEELPHADIAQILGCSRHAVDQRIHRATRRLGRQLERQTRATPSGIASPQGGNRP